MCRLNFWFIISQLGNVIFQAYEFNKTRDFQAGGHSGELHLSF